MSKGQFDPECAKCAPTFDSFKESKGTERAKPGRPESAVGPDE